MPKKLSHTLVDVADGAHQRPHTRLATTQAAEAGMHMASVGLAVRPPLVDTRRVRTLVLMFLTACSSSMVPAPVMPPIHDRAIVFGQRVGPVSLGMTEQQLFNAVGKVSETNYGANRRGYLYADLKLNVVVDTGRVVLISPTDGSYATSEGIHVGSREQDLLSKTTAPAPTRHHQTASDYCYGDHTLVTVGATSGPACTAGEICDIVIGGCTP